MMERIIAEEINRFAKEYDWYDYCNSVEDESEYIENTMELLIDRDQSVVDWLKECIEDMEEDADYYADDIYTCRCILDSIYELEHVED